MREKLSRIKGSRGTFSGTFVRFGIKNGFKGPERTVLLKDVKDENGQVVADHLWFNLTKGFKSLNLIEGDEVEFDARAKEYIKGYKGRNERARLEAPLEIDYLLSYPTRVHILPKRRSYEEVQID